MKDTKVIEFPASENFTAEQALQSTMRLDCSDVICIGYSNGELVIRSSKMTRSDALFLIEQSRQWAVYGNN